MSEMDQMMRFAGLQLSSQGAQITCCGGAMKEPGTLSLPGERSDGMMDVPQEVWRQLVYGLPGKNGPAAANLSPAGKYLSKLLGYIPSAGGRDSRLLVCVSLPRLTELTGRHVTDALGEAGIARRDIFLQDYRTSFYYYVVNKRRELETGDVAILMEKEHCMKGYILHVDKNASPRTASIREEGSADVSDKARAGRSGEDWDSERDRLLYELLGKLYERRNVVSTYLYGAYFDGSWARRSFQYMTFHRRAYQGQNLFSKGACYGAMARTGLIRMPDIVLLGVDMVRENVSLDVRVKGKERQFPLVRAGVNWYDAHGECEVIPDGERNISILSQRSGEERTISHVLRLDHFPVRPDRASRLRLNVWFSSPYVLEAEVTDLGFGDLYPASGRVWHRQVRFGRDAE